jgi:hypothetical protein
MMGGGMGVGGVGGMPLPAGAGMGAAGGGESFSFLNDSKKDAFSFVGDEIGKNKTKL